jgi:thiazole synthase ThiGH ThiG subunit
MKNDVFWDVTRVAVVSTDVSEVFLRSVRRLLVTASVFPSSQIIVTLMKEALSSSETSVLTITTRRKHTRRRRSS